MIRNSFGAFLLYASISAIYVYVSNKEISPKFNDEFIKRGIFINTNYGGKFKYLTILNLYAQTVYFVICTLNVLYEFVAGTRSKRTWLRNFLNFAYTTLVFPVGACVTILFWGIYLVDRDLIFPKILDEIIPPWHNHVLHTLPLISAIIDNLITQYEYKKSTFWGALPTVIYGLGYLAWIVVIAYRGGFWVYPIIAVLGPLYRTLFLAASLLTLVGFYQLGKWTNSLIWGSKVEKTQKNKKSR